MAKITICVCVFVIASTLVLADPTKTIVKVELGGFCSLGAAPVGPGGSWQVVEKNVEKVCPSGSSCRNGACNCDDRTDGTVMSLAVDEKGERVCKRIAGQKCSASTDCFKAVDCVQGKCVCDKTKVQFCVDTKQDAIILN